MADRGLFYKALDRTEARNVFARSVSDVEIETHSYCNRRCNYCPNAFIDRISDNKFIDDDIFEGVITDLAEIGFRGSLVLSHYNEPLADRRILKYISRARAKLPLARIAIFTNGDYLKKSYLADLVEAGISDINISIHLADTAAYDDIKILNRLSEMSVRIGIPAQVQHYCVGMSVLAIFPHDKVSIRIFEQDYANIGGTRGGLMKHIAAPPQRTSPCSRPFNSMVIAHNGFIMPCCQLRADAPEHEKYRIGHMSEFPSIFEAYAASTMVDWRRGLFTFGPKTTPCADCNQACIDATPEEVARREAMAVEFGLTAPARAAPVLAEA